MRVRLYKTAMKEVYNSGWKLNDVLEVLKGCRRGEMCPCVVYKRNIYLNGRSHLEQQRIKKLPAWYSHFASKGDILINKIGKIGISKGNFRDFRAIIWRHESAYKQVKKQVEQYWKERDNEQK